MEQLANFEGQTVKIQSLEQMLRNEKDQREAIQTELNQTIRRCNEVTFCDIYHLNSHRILFEAEEEAFQLRRQLRNESSARTASSQPTDDGASASSAYMSLHEELNGGTTSITSDQSELSSRSGEDSHAEWKTKFDVLVVEHERQKKE